jgi:opacity protein-like surface antigen
MKEIILAVFVAVLLVANMAIAADFEDASSLISINAPAGADVAGMGNVWASLPDFSSNNPATYAAGVDVDKCKGSVSGTYTMLGFRHGPNVNAFSLSPAVKLPVGFLKATIVGANSANSGTNMGIDMKYNSLMSVNVGYGFKAADDVLVKGDKFFVGVDATPYSRSKLTFSFLDQRIAKSESDSYAVGAGVLYQPTKAVNFGAYYSYGRGESKDTDFMFGETEKSRFTDQQLRIGASWQVLPMTLVAADWQYVNLNGYRKGQLFAGVEQGIIKDFLYVYAGWAANGPTAGIGMYFKKGGINVAYMSTPFSESDRYLGRSQVITAGAYYTF